MLYTVLKATIKIGIKVFFKNIQIRGLENLPLDRPVLIACNHPNAFMDALVVSVFVKKPFHYLARGDAFKTSFMSWFLSQLKLIPIYRVQEGVDQLQKNEETFDKCYKLLQNKGIVMVFPEGICVQERRLRKLKKGMAKIAFGAQEFSDYNLDLCIVPVGINYTTPSKSGGDVYINIAPPIEVSEYTREYKKDKAKTINQLTSDVELEMAKLIVIIENESDDLLAEQIETLYKEKLISEFEIKKADPELDFTITQKIAQGINYFHKYKFDQYKIIKDKVHNYFNELKQPGIKDQFLRPEIINRNLLSILLPKIILLLLSFPLHVIGLITNYIPYKFPYLLTKKIVKSIEFFSSVNIALGTFIFIFYYLFQVTLFTNLFKDYTLTIIFLLVAPLSGFFSLNYLKLYKEVKAIVQIKNNLNKAKKQEELRTEIINEIGLAKEQYQGLQSHLIK